MASERNKKTLIAKYRATIGVFGIESSFEFIGDVMNSSLAGVISRRPAWTPFEWPSSAATSQGDLKRMALIKLMSVFDFGANIEASTPADIREALLATNPGLLQYQVSNRNQQWKRIPVTAELFSDGHFQGGYDYPDEGVALPLRDTSEETLDQFVKNMVRADMREMLGSISSTENEPD